MCSRGHSGRELCCKSLLIPEFLKHQHFHYWQTAMVGHASAAGCQIMWSFNLVPSLLVPTSHQRSQLTGSTSGQLCNMHNIAITPCARYFGRREVIWGGYSRFILFPSAKCSHVPFFFRTPALSRAWFCRALSPTMRGWVLSFSWPSVAMESTHSPSGMLNTFQKWPTPSSTRARINSTGTG